MHFKQRQFSQAHVIFLFGLLDVTQASVTGDTMTDEPKEIEETRITSLKLKEKAKEMKEKQEKEVKEKE